MKNKYIATWSDNFGECVAIIYADTEEEARKMCDESKTIWNDYYLETLEERIFSTILFI